MIATHKLLRFGVFELNLDTEELRKAGTIMKLAPQPFRLLALLATHSGQIVSREEIQGQLWGEETFVDFEQGMNHCIKQIRTVLGDNADNPLYVETLPRRGYRFLAPVISKNVLAPAPQIIKSQSGIQSAILPALRPDRTPALPKPMPAEPAAKATPGSKQPTPKMPGVTETGPDSASGVVPVYGAQATARAEVPAQRNTDNSATAAANALASEMARWRKSPGWAHSKLAWLVAIFLLVLAGALYWYLRAP